jgi:CRISPR-associated protein Cas2
VTVKQFLVVSYDISNDKRRLKVMKTLQDYGTRVQYSVFECRLESKQLDLLKRRIKPLAREKQDSIRFYYLSADDIQRIDVIGNGSVTPDHIYFMQ